MSLKKITGIFITTVLLAITFSCKEENNNNITISVDSSEIFESTSNGCSNFKVYKSNKSNSKVIVVEVNSDKLEIVTSTQIFDIAKHNENINIFLDYYPDNETETKQPWYPYCDDVMYQDYKDPQKWTATKGTIEISRSEDYEQWGQTSYDVTVRIKEVYLYDVNNENEIYIKDLLFEDVRVGWYPG